MEKNFYRRRAAGAQESDSQLPHKSHHGGSELPHHLLKEDVTDSAGEHGRDPLRPKHRPSIQLVRYQICHAIGRTRRQEKKNPLRNLHLLPPDWLPPKRIDRDSTLSVESRLTRSGGNFPPPGRLPSDANR